MPSFMFVVTPSDVVTSFLFFVLIAGVILVRCRDD